MKCEFNIKEDIFKHQITAIDSHTSGEFLRLIVSGIPELTGATMIERRNEFRDKYDYIRTALMLEPRGHKDMFGAVLTEPVTEEADFGIFYIESAGYIDMCGHGTIAAVTDLVEAGMVPMQEPFTTITFDTPAGTVQAKARIENGHVAEVSLVNVPSFVYRENLGLELDGRKIKYDIAFGGSFFTMVDISQFDTTIKPEHISKIADWGIRILELVNEQVEIRHPLLNISGTNVCEFYSETETPEADMRNVVIFGEHQADRSPCGTGTSAKLALLARHHRIKSGEILKNESFIGGLFKGQIIGETNVGEYPAVIPEITGSAYMTGISIYLIDKRDPLKYGFLVK